MPDVLVRLTESRENLLREYIISKGVDRAIVLANILEIEDEIEEEKARRHLSPQLT